MLKFNHCDAQCFFSRMIYEGAVIYDAATGMDTVGKRYHRVRFTAESAVIKAEVKPIILGYIDNYPSGDTHHYLAGC